MVLRIRVPLGKLSFIPLKTFMFVGFFLRHQEFLSKAVIQPGWNPIINRTGISKRDRGHSPRQLRPKLIYAKTQHIVANKCRVMCTVRVLGGESRVFSSNGFMCCYQKYKAMEVTLRNRPKRHQLKYWER
jgi:hypothetical protein